MLKVYLLMCLVSLIEVSSGKILTPEELSDELLANGISKDQVPTFQCIVNWESAYDTSALNLDQGKHGIFQISEIYWCSPTGTACPKTSCSSLRDDDITNDIKCMKIMYDEFELMTGNGFEAWSSYDEQCRYLE